MGKTIKRVIALLLSATAVILLLIPAGNVEATYNKGDFVIDGGTLVSYTGNETDLTIPLGITTIGKDCFSKNNNLNSVYIPDEVTSIDYAAFENCKNLQKVDIGDIVKSIGSSLNDDEIEIIGPFEEVEEEIALLHKDFWIKK